MSSTSYGPTRLADWYEPEPESWLRGERSEDDYGWRLERAIAIVEALASAQSPEVEQSLQERLREQAEKWERETAHLSSPLQRMMHPSYQAILGMGAEHKREVICFLLRDLQQNRRDWFLALSYLSQANPINPRDAGKTDKLVNSWVKWGKEQGLL
jgi:hypothetical protein